MKNLLIPAALACAVLLPFGASQVQAQTPEIESIIDEIKALPPQERAEALKEVREFMRNLPQEDKDKMRESMVQKAAQHMAYFDNLSQDEKLELHRERDRRLNELSVKAEDYWNSLSAEQQAEYLEKAKEKSGRGQGMRHGKGGTWR